MCFRCLIFSLLGHCELFLLPLELSCGECNVISLYVLCFSVNGSTGQVGLGVGSWPSNRATEGSNPKGTRLYFVILLKNVEKNI